MRRFTYRCEPCGLSYEELVAGTGAPPATVRCHSCGQQATREWVAPQILVSDSEIEYRQRDMVKVHQRHDPHGRNAKQIQRETDTILKSKRLMAQRMKRAKGLSKTRGMRHLGSIDAREFAAYNKRAGDKNAFFNNPIEALRRTGNSFID